MSFTDSFDFDYDYAEQDDRGTTCMHCGVEGLDWVHTGARWRLFDGTGLHVCRPSIDDFEDLDA